MKKINIYLIPLLLLTLAAPSPGQFYETPRQSGVGLPFFDVEIFRTFNQQEASPRIYVYFDILYDDLTFVRADTGDGFMAKFELVAAIYDDDDLQVTARMINEDVYVDDYAITNSRKESRSLSRHLDVPPGTYTLKLRVTDLISKKTMNRNIEFNLEDFRDGEAGASDLLFVSELFVDSTGQIVGINPRVRDNFSRMQDHFYVYFDFYAGTVPQDLVIRYRFVNPDGDAAIDTTVEKTVDNRVTSHMIQVNKNDLSRNRYQCVVEIESEDDDIERAKGLSFFWVTVPETEDDIDLAIRQMRYIIPGDSLNRYEDAPIEEQKAFFERWWKSRDPNPNTTVNELMEEYYSRVNYANREYSNFNEGGWLSDRGRILIKFGYPDDIERHPFEIDTYPYEIWRYYGLRKVFVFADRTGFGDYRLLPEYMDQEFY